MKKMYISYALLALALIACVPGYAAQAAKEQHEESRLAQARHAAKKQLNESIARLKKCVNLNCSKMEALKAARDVTIAVLALYVGGRATQTARKKAIKELPKSMRKPVRTLTGPIMIAEETAMLPVNMVSELVGYTIRPTVGETYEGYFKVYARNPEKMKIRVTKVETIPHSGETIIYYDALNDRNQTSTEGIIPLWKFNLRALPPIKKKTKQP